MNVTIKQDFMTCCHPLINNQESHTPAKEKPEHWGGRSNRFNSLSHSLLYFYFFYAFTHTLYREITNESENQDAKSYENTFPFVSSDRSDQC